MKNAVFLLMMVILASFVAGSIYDEDKTFQSVSQHSGNPSFSILMILIAITALLYIYVLLKCGLRQDRVKFKIVMGDPPKKHELKKKLNYKRMKTSAKKKIKKKK